MNRKYQRKSEAALADAVCLDRGGKAPHSSRRASDAARKSSSPLACADTTSRRYDPTLIRYFVVWFTSKTQEPKGLAEDESLLPYVEKLVVYGCHLNDFPAEVLGKEYETPWIKSALITGYNRIRLHEDAESSPFNTCDRRTA